MVELGWYCGKKYIDQIQRPTTSVWFSFKTKGCQGGGGDQGEESWERTTVGIFSQEEEPMQKMDSDIQKGKKVADSRGRRCREGGWGCEKAWWWITWSCPHSHGVYCIWVCLCHLVPVLAIAKTIAMSFSYCLICYFCLLLMVMYILQS